MKQLCTLAAVAAFGLGSLPAAADQISLDDISSYLNAMSTAQGEFTQLNTDGTLSTGVLYLKRPGRVRFSYNPPDNSLVMSGGGQVAVFDPASNQPPERFPLNQTPLKVILDDNVNFASSPMIVSTSADDTATYVVAQDPDHPEYGNIQLVFTDNPVQLRQWVIDDGAGGLTTVILGDLEVNVGLNNSLFNIRSEMRDRGFEID